MRQTYVRATYCTVTVITFAAEACEKKKPDDAA